MADINVGGVQATVTLDAKQFEAGIKQVVASLEMMQQSFQQTQTSISNRVSALSGNVTKGTKAITGSINSMSRDIHDGLELVIQGTIDATTAINNNSKVMASAFGRVTASIGNLDKSMQSTSRTIVTQANTINQSISRMDSNLVAGLLDVIQELQLMRQEFTRVQTVSRQDFTQGIQRLTRATGRSTQAVVANLREIQNEARNTNNALNNLGNGGNNRGRGNGGNNGGGMFDWLRGLSNNRAFQGMLNSAQGFVGAMEQGAELLGRMSFQGFLLEQAFRQVKSLVETFAKPAVDFNSQMETLRLGYAGIISSTMIKKDSGEQVSYNEALQVSNALLAKMQDQALKTSLTMSELGTALQSTMAMGLNAGMSLEQVLDLTVVGAQAVKTFGLSNQQVIQELRGLISGEAIRPGVDQLATVLGYTTATVNKLREEGKLYEDVMKRMKGFAMTSEEFQNTWAGLTSNIEDGISRVAGVAGEALFQNLKKSTKQLQDMFFTVEKIQGKDGGFDFKVELNQETLAIAQSFYNTLSNLWQVIAMLGQYLGTAFAPLLKALLIIFEKLSSILVIVVQMLGFVADGFTMIFGAIEACVEWLSDLFEQTFYTNDGMQMLVTTLGALTVTFLACAHPIIALIGLVGLLGVAFGAVKKPLSNFGEWFSLFCRMIELKWQVTIKRIGAGISAVVSNPVDLLTGKKTLNELFDNAFNVNGGSKLEDSLKLVESKFDRTTSDMIDGIRNNFRNAYASIDKGSTDLFDKLKGAFTADKQKKGSKGAQNDARRSEYKALEDAFKDEKKLLEQQLKINSDLYKKDLISTQDFIRQKLALKWKEIQFEEQMLQAKLKIAEAGGKKTEVTSIRDSLKSLDVKKQNLLVQTTIDLTSEYQKLDERLEKISQRYEKIAGVGEESFKNHLAREVAADYTRLAAELKTCEENLKKVSEVDDVKKWEERKRKITEAVKATNKYVELQGIQHAISIKQAQLERQQLELQEKFVEQRALVDAGAGNSLLLEQQSWYERRRNASETVNIYKELIEYYKKMAESANDAETYNKAYKHIVELKKGLQDFANELSPLRKQLQTTFSEGMADAFNNALWGEKSILDSMKDLGKNMLKQFTQQLFDGMFSNLSKDLFDKLMPNGAINKEVKAKVEATVSVNVSPFVDAVQQSAMALQQGVAQGLVPSFTNLQTLIEQGLSPEITALIQKLSQVPYQKDVGENSNSVMDGKSATTTVTPTATKSVGTQVITADSLGLDTTQLQTAIQTLSQALQSLASNADKVTTNFGGVKTEAKGVANADKDQKKWTTDNTIAMGMMATSLIATTTSSEKLQKAMIVLQGIMMAFQALKVGGVFGLATGGYVSGPGTSTSDSIPARLSDGEYVIRASSVKKYGTNFLDMINGGRDFSRSGRLPKFAFADGGLVSKTDAEENSLVRDSSVGNNQGTVVNMNMTFQSLDPESNMKMMEAQYPSIRQRLLRDLQGNSAVRTAVRGVR